MRWWLSVCFNVCHYIWLRTLYDFDKGVSHANITKHKVNLLRHIHMQTVTFYNHFGPSLSDYFHHDILQFLLPAVCFLALAIVSQSLHILRSGEGDFIGLITDVSNSPVGVLHLA